jgi:hypothetical protein
VRAGGEAVVRYSDDLPTTGTTGSIQDMALYAGQGVALAAEVAPAGAIARGLTEDARQTLARLVT